MRGNTVTIEMPLKRGKVAKTIPLYQYDYGQKLLFTGIELPAYYEVHFSNEMHGEATTKIGTSEGVDIPDVYLSTGEPVYLWLYLHSEVTDGETEFQGSIPVIKRASISDQTPTPEEATVIAEAIVALNEAAEALDGAVESAEAAQEGAEAAEDGAEEQALKAEGYAVGKQDGADVDSSSPYYHNNAKYYNDQAGSSATAASGSATAASGSATSAEAWATGGSGGTSSATNNAKYYSEQAASSASTANSAKSDAVSAKNTAATWATGGTTGTPSSTNNAKYYSEQASSSAEDAASSESAAEASSLEAEGYAVGKQNGEDVSSGTYYHNNAKYYAGEAGTSATNAGTSETNASGYATTAGQKAALAESWATGGTSGTPSATNNSKYYSEQAASSANAADGSADDAGASALVAEGFAVGQQDGVDVGSSSPYYENNAKYYSEVAEAATSTKADLIEDTLSTPAAIQSFPDGANGLPMEIECEIAPKQDLHGYDNPWPAGGGKNLFPMILSEIKANNTFGTWNGNTYTYNGCSFTIQTDNDGNVTGVALSGTSTGTINFFFAQNVAIKSGQYIMSKGSGAMADDGNTNLYIYDFTGLSVIAKIQLNISGSTSSTSTANVASDLDNTSFYINVNKVGAVLSGTIKPQFESGSTATDFAPYSNICPISGFTGANVQRDGKNLLKNTGTTYTHKGVTFTVNADGSITMTGTNDNTSYSYLAISTTFNAENGVGYIMSGGVSSNIYMRDTNAAKSDEGSGASFTGDGTEHRIEIRVVKGYAITGSVTVYPMIRLSSVSDATFEPFNGTTYPITFPQAAGTVYGGTLTIHQDGSGELVVDHADVDLGTLTWARQPNKSVFRTNDEIVGMKPTTSTTVSQNIICDTYKTETWVHVLDLTGYDCCICEGWGGKSYIAINDTRYNDYTAEQFKSAMSGVHLVYELATPVTYQLTNQQVIALLKGANNVWCDTGNINAITYPADTKLYIDKKFVELQALILENISNS